MIDLDEIPIPIPYSLVPSPQSLFPKNRDNRQAMQLSIKSIAIIASGLNLMV
jgi:hypothetical protein